MVDFPELASFGTLLEYALALEEVLARAGTAAAAAGPALQDLARKHEKRRQQLERMRRERLNEVVLQAITGMDRESYLPDALLMSEDLASTDIGGIMSHLAVAETRAGAFYDDAAGVAVNVLGGLDKTFRKLAAENRALAEVVGRAG